MLSKEKLNSSAINSAHELSEEETNKLKETILSILLDVDATCRKHGFHYYLAYGTLLGAVRHKGFIPWDDDIDILVPFWEMDGLREAMVVDYGDRYFFGGLSPADGNDPNCQMKIMLTGTTYTEIQNTSFPFPRGIGIDTFPICHMPKNRLMEKIRQKHGQMLMHIIAVEMEYRYPPSSLLDKKADKKIRHYYKFRQFLGFLFSFHSLMYWKNRYIRFCSKEFNNSEFLSIGEDFRFNLCGNQVTKKTLEESAYSFEGHSLISIKDYDSYLETYYGDYMTFPAVQKRDKHIVASVTFLDEATK